MIFIEILAGCVFFTKINLENCYFHCLECKEHADFTYADNVCF